MGRALSLDPLVSLAMMAGVLSPMVMLASGMLARWAIIEPFTGRMQGSPRLNSLASGLMTAAGGALLFGAMLALSRNNVFPGAGMPGLSARVLPGAAVILGAYVALAVIGSELYAMIFQRARQ